MAKIKLGGAVEAARESHRLQHSAAKYRVMAMTRRERSLEDRIDEAIEAASKRIEACQETLRVLSREVDRHRGVYAENSLGAVAAMQVVGCLVVISEEIHKARLAVRA